MGSLGWIAGKLPCLSPLSFLPLTEPQKGEETNGETITALLVFDKPLGFARVGTLLV
jgi:hypothetical protein